MMHDETTELHGKTVTGISVPSEVIAALGTSKRPPVRGMLAHLPSHRLD